MSTEQRHVLTPCNHVLGMVSLPLCFPQNRHPDLSGTGGGLGQDWQDRVSGRQTGTRIRAPLPSKTGPSIEKSGWREDQRERNEIQTDMDREEQRLLSVPRGHSDAYPVGLLRSCLPHPEFSGFKWLIKITWDSLERGL